MNKSKQRHKFLAAQKKLRFMLLSRFGVHEAVAYHQVSNWSLDFGCEDFPLDC